MSTVIFTYSHEFGFSLGILAHAAGDQVIFILNVTSTEVEEAPLKETDFKCALMLPRHSFMTGFNSCPSAA